VSARACHWPLAFNVMRQGYSLCFRAVHDTRLWLTACLSACAAAAVAGSSSGDAAVAVRADASTIMHAGPGRGRAHAEDRDGAGQPDARAGRQRAPAVRHGRAGCTGTAPPFLREPCPEAVFDANFRICMCGGFCASAEPVQCCDGPGTVVMSVMKLPLVPRRDATLLRSRPTSRALCSRSR